MAIINREIMEDQVKRINEKAKTEIILRKSNGMWYLCTSFNHTEFPPTPFSGVNTMRTTKEMIEYLRGIEDAVDVFTGEKKF